MSIAIVTDSSSDIPENLAEASQIHIVPNIIIVNGKSLEDKAEISRYEFYKRLPAMKTLPTTSAAPSGSFQKLYERLFQQGFSQIISIHASSLLSGIFNSASLAAQAFRGAVKVIDSGQVTLGLGFQVLAAAEAVAQGLTVENVLAKIEDVHRRVRLFAMLDTMEYVRRSGRISWARASLGSLLRIKPLIELKEGRVLRLAEVRTRHKGIERLFSLLHGLGNVERLAVLHTNAEEDAQHLLDRLDNNIVFPPLIVNATTIIGTHVGPSALGFAVVIL